MPVTIKRYPNRKLYDTAQKRYISLEAVASLVRQGEEVNVVDNDTGEDLTALTLAQIIMEQEKKQSGFLPGAVLAGLVQAGGEPLEGLRRMLTGPLGLSRLVEEELSRRMEVLVGQKVLTSTEGRRLLTRLLQAGQRIDEPSLAERMIGKYLDAQGIPTRQDLLKLMVQIDELTEKVDELKPEG